MKIDIVFTLSAGGDFTTSTTDFLSLEAFQAEIEKFVGHPAGRITWHDRDGSKRTLAAPHIVAVKFAQAGS
jgi:hypothetical protein